jgi:hypothetical protein
MQFFIKEYYTRFSAINRQGIKAQIHRLILATKAHKGTQRKKEYPNHTNEKLLEVQKPFLEKVFGRRRQKLTVDFGRSIVLIFSPIYGTVER